MSHGILLITDCGDRHGHVAERMIAAGLPVSGIITHAKHDARKQHAAPASVQVPPLSGAEREALRAVKRQRRTAESEAFDGAFARLNDRHARRIVARVEPQDGSINARRFLDLIAASRPRLVVVMGAAMLGRDLLASGPAFVNLHTGISPYYRGGRCNMWPIVEGEFGYFGFTLHRIAPGIDDGGLFATRRILVQPGDDYARINCRAIIEGADALIEVAGRLLERPDAPGIAQWSKGKLFLDRHYSAAAARAYLENLPSFIDEHIARQESNRLDRIRLIAPEEAFAA